MSNINIEFISPANLARFKSKADLEYAAKAAVDVLIGSDAGKSARAIAAEELAAQLIPANAQEALNTLAEVAAWIQQHPEDAAALNAAIAALQAKVDTEGTVSEAVAAAINALGISAYAKTADLGALAAKDTVAEADLAAELKAKVNAAADGNHSHDNKTVLDGVTAEKVAAWDAKSDFSGAYADLNGKPTIPSTVAEMTDAANYALKTDIPTFTEATDAQIDAMFA